MYMLFITETSCDHHLSNSSANFAVIHTHHHVRFMFVETETFTLVVGNALAD